MDVVAARSARISENMTHATRAAIRETLYEDDFDAYDKSSHCGYFLDKRNDEKYQPPNGTVLDFYKDIVKEVSHDHQ